MLGLARCPFILGDLSQAHCPGRSCQQGLLGSQDLSGEAAQANWSAGREGVCAQNLPQQLGTLKLCGTDQPMAGSCSVSRGWSLRL